MAKNDAAGCFLLVIIGLLVSAVVKLKESMGDPAFFGSIALLVILGIYIAVLGNRKKKQLLLERISMLLEKYGDQEIVDRIIAKNYWQGQTLEMLLDSLGKPSAVEEEILKTKKKEIWKYFPDGTNKYKLRITLENDSVVGWKSR